MHLILPVPSPSSHRGEEVSVPMSDVINTSKKNKKCPFWQNLTQHVIGGGFGGTRFLMSVVSPVDGRQNKTILPAPIYSRHG
jgi:hypothetical protein